MISVDTKSLSDYKKKLRKLQRGVPYAMMKVLNDSAFGTRETAINNISMQMIVRSGRFIKSRVKVDKATKNTLVARTGSIKSDRFSGLLEQEIGGKKRHISKHARRGSLAHIIPPRYRLNPSKRFKKAVNKGAFKAIRYLDRHKYKKPFIIANFFAKKGYEVLPPGLYRFSGKRNWSGEGKPWSGLLMLQNFDKPSTVRKRPWMKLASGKYFQKTPLSAIWEVHLSRAIRDSKKK